MFVKDVILLCLGVLAAVGAALMVMLSVYSHQTVELKKAYLKTEENLVKSHNFYMDEEDQY